MSSVNGLLFYSLLRPSFPTKDELSGHIDEVHPATRPTYLCPHCGKTLFSPPSLCRHIRHKHPTRLFECTSCSYTTANKSLLKLHIQNHHSALFQCSQCQEA